MAMPAWNYPDNDLAAKLVDGTRDQDERARLPLPLQTAAR